MNRLLVIAFLLISLLSSCIKPEGSVSPADAAATIPAAKTTLTIMTYNIWGGGANEGKPVDETVAVIRAANADIIGVQETRLEADPCTAESCPAVGASVVKAMQAPN